jgi:hypothetical protein
MDLSKGIRNPNQLREAIEMAKTGDKEAVWAIHKYKWYNWYQNIHIKQGTPEDVENTQIFQELERDHPEIHEQVEDNIEYEIKKLNYDLD